ncbi:hypothetical protein JCM10908_004104 [Rhodotorula pacifica]|uniref:DNA ligase (ATP) DNL4 n=1 Tax=Rhodotorula pacifica TaxID=1495444 RepID=UPI003181725B
MSRRHFYPRRKGSPAPSGDKDDDDEMTDVLQRAQPDEIEKPANMSNFDKLPFGVLCSIYDELEKATRTKHKHKSETKGQMIETFFRLWRERIGNDLYPVVRLMLPERDTRRRTYNLKEQKLAKALVEALDLPRNSTAAIKLEHWKTPTKDDPGAGEFASVAYDVIKSRSTVTTSRSDTTIDSINDVLDKLSQTTSLGEDGQKRSLAAEHAKILKRCVTNMTPGEMKWLIRIILRDLKIGVGEKTIFDRLHPDAMSVFNTCSDIKHVCYKLYDLNYRVGQEDKSVKLMQSFKPMLCWRSHSHLEDVVKAMHRSRNAFDPSRQLEPGEYGNREFIVEEKLDGERIQLHKQGKRFQYFSRHAKNYTYLYGENATSGSLTPFLGDAIDDEVEEVILDGEMLVWEPHVQKYMAFGNLKSYAKVEASEIGDFDPRPCYKVFDILYIKGKNGKGECLLDKSLWRRKLLLSQVIKHKTGVIEIADCAKASTKEEIHAFLVRILEERGEGLVVKHPLAKYTLGARESAWIKIKPEYMDELGENIDGVVIGGYWGQGRRSGIMASYLIGLSAVENGKTIYHTFAKIGSGFSRTAYEEIARKTDGKWRTLDRKQPGAVPDWFHTVSEWPDCLIEPHDSFVIEIKAAEIVKGDDYGAGLTLRFPRAKKISNKPPESAMDYATILSFRRAPKRNPFGEEMGAKSKRQRTDRATKRHAVAEAVGTVEAESELFAGTTFYVHRTDPESKKTELKRSIATHGGTLIEKIPNADIDRVVVSCAFTGLANRKGAKNCDVVSPAWVEDSISNLRRMPLNKRYLVHATDETKASPEYEDDEDDVESGLPDGGDLVLDLPEDKEEHKPTTSPTASPPPTHAPLGSAQAWRERHNVDSEEDEPDTEDEDNLVIVSNHSDTEEDSSTIGERGEGWKNLFPRQQVLSAPLNAVNQNLGHLGLDESIKSEPEERMQKLDLDPAAYTESPVGMGAGVDDKKDFDPDLYLSPFVGYFDTQLNASLNNLPESAASPKVRSQADKALLKAKKGFEEAGGVATDQLDDPKLTHIIVSRLVPDRFKEMIRRTLEPRARRLVTTDWVDACLENEGAMDEDDFKP